MNCSQCGRENPADALRCEHCDAWLEPGAEGAPIVPAAGGREVPPEEADTMQASEEQVAASRTTAFSAVPTESQTIPPEDSEALIGALERLLDDPAGASEQGMAGRRFVETWPGPQDIARRYEDLFIELRRDR